MHKGLEDYLSDYRKIKFSGEDLSLVVGDIVYAMAVRAFLSVREDNIRKERALGNFLEAAIYTGTGEFVELLSGVKDIKDTSGGDPPNDYIDAASMVMLAFDEDNDYWQLISPDANP